jgi:hypothetical protein
MEHLNVYLGGTDKKMVCEYGKRNRFREQVPPSTTRMQAITLTFYFDLSIISYGSKTSFCS